MNNIKVISDSLADIPKDIINKYDIEIIPLTIRIEEKDYKDGVDISNKDFYSKLRNSIEMPKTSQATYIQFEKVFRKYVDEGKKIIYISGSSKVTGTYQSAVMAKENIGGNIEIFDSLNLSFGCGSMVVSICEMIKLGYTLEKLLESLEEIRKTTTVLFTVDTLEYLKKGGRISKTKATLGTILNVKPILEVSNGEINNLLQVRGSNKAVSKIINIIKERYNNDLKDKIIGIAHADNIAGASSLKEKILKEFNVSNITDIEIGPSIGAHTGPGTIGVCISNKY